ncbi:MAG: hypothetical protein ACFCU1_01025 [Sumerlaeia bacterium]
MTKKSELGVYSLSLTQRGISVSRRDIKMTNMLGMGGGSDYNPTLSLYFTLAEAGGGEVVIPSVRLHSESPEVVSFHGALDDRIALDVDIKLNTTIDSLQLVCHLEASSEDIVARLGIHLEMSGEADPKWLIPGLFYNQNKAKGCDQKYPSYSEIQRDIGKFISNHWNFRSDRAALPVIFCTTYSMMAFISTDDRVAVSEDYPQGRGIASLGISGEEGSPVLSVHAPYIEDPVKFSFCHENKSEPEQTYIELRQNQPLIVACQIGFSPLPERGVAWHKPYRALYAERISALQVLPRMESEEAERLAMDGIIRWHFDRERTLLHETCAFDRRFGRHGANYEADEMHVGWTSGVMPAYTMLWYGRNKKVPDCVYSAQAILNRLTNELTPCGTLWPLFTVDGPEPGFGPADNLAHSRTIAEAIFFLIRSFRLELQNATLQPKWYWAIQSNLAFAIKNQRDDGAFPSYWNIDTGEVYDYNGSSGLVWVAAMAAYNHFDSTDRFYESATRAAEYYLHFLEEDFLHGSQEDQPLVPTCDDCHFAVIAFMLLYETSGDIRWLDACEQAANLALTFRMAYNSSFSPFSMLGQNNFKTVGGDIGSVSQPSLTIRGLISYGEFKKLSALTGDPYYEQRAAESRVFATQMLARSDGEYNARLGMAIGEVFHTDWLQPKGMISTLGHIWTGALITYTELIERNLIIPMAALQGQQEGLENALKFHGEQSYDAQIVMPESAANLRRRGKDGIKTDIEEFRRQNASGIVRRPVTTIGTNPNLTPFPESNSSDILSKFGSHFGLDSESDSKNKFSRIPGESEQKRPESWNFAPPAGPSKAKPPTGFDSRAAEQYPTAGSSASFNQTPQPRKSSTLRRPAAGTQNSPFGNQPPVSSHHTPLSSDQVMQDELRAKMLEPLMGKGDSKDKNKKLSDLSPGMAPMNDLTEKNPDLGPPPAHLMQGLLSNLMGSMEEGPVINPSGGPDLGLGDLRNRYSSDSDDEPFVPYKDRGYEVDSSSDDSSQNNKQEDDDDDQEIKYKIF